ncbi:MAG TPA: ABC transporter permease [Rhizomicrobium sp.]
MKRAFLIARQEFIKYVTRRGFALSILMFPLWIMIVILVPQWTGGGDGGAREHYITVVDRAGGVYRRAVAGAVERRRAHRELAGLSHYALAYADMHKLRQASPAVAAMLENPNSPRVLRDYRAVGGDAAVSSQLSLKPGAPRYETQPTDISDGPAPDYLVGASGERFAVAVRRAFAQEREYGLDNTPHLEAVVVVPADFGAEDGHPAQIWAQGRADATLKDFVADALTQALRFNDLRKIAPQLHDPEILDVTADVQARDPDRASGHNSAIDSIVPIALAIILFVVSVMNSSVLLQGVVEEKSTRMIEVLLSCATAREITSGKLIGVIAVALTTLLIWALALFALMAIASHDTAALVFTSLRATASLETLPLLLVFFLCGLLIYGSLFLAIGSMANSLADAQSLLGPSMLILMLPNLMIAGVMREPNGALASTLSWVPIYTPFFMMLRIASHPPVWQLWGTVLLAVTTTALLIWWTGRVFARHVLTTERPPSLGALVRGGVAALTRRKI